MKPTKTDFTLVARAAWDGAPPDWVETLAAEATRTSGTAAAVRLGYSQSVVSATLRNKYSGDLALVEGKVRGAFMGLVVDCPVLGEIGRDRCLTEQGFKFSCTSELRAKLWRACRGGCPHSRVGGDHEGGIDER